MPGLSEVENGNIWYGDQLSVEVQEGENGYTFMSVSDEYDYYEASNHILTAPNEESGVGIPYLFVMIDPTEEKGTWKPSGLYEYGKSNYEVLYCCDVKTGVKDGVYYKRVNLEDSNYYDAEAASHVRAIVTNSYPYISLDEMKANLKEAGFEDAENLTRSEIITAVQGAIWSFANEDDNKAYDKVNYNDLYQYKTSYHVPDKTRWGTVLHEYSAEMAEVNPETGELTYWWKQNPINEIVPINILVPIPSNVFGFSSSGSAIPAPPAIVCFHLA